MNTKMFLILGLVVALLLAGGGSYYASSNPDGLERVAEEAGFSDTAEDPTAGSPFTGYATTGVENDRLSGGLAGIVGSLMVLVLVCGLTCAVRRRGRAAEKTDEPTELSRRG